MTFGQLRVLRAVARTGNMTRAAEELDTTQSAVSHALGSLERELGLTLFVRSSGGVALTAAGRAVSRRATLILSQLEALHQEASAARGESGGRLRIGVIPSANARLLPRILRAFQTAHERVRLTVIEGSDAEVAEWLRTGAVDVGTVTSADGAAAAASVVTTPLARDRMLALVPIGHPLAAREATSVAELSRFAFIMSTGGCEPLITALATRAGVRLRCHYQVRDTNSILAMVAEHLGVSVMPELSLPPEHPGVCAIPLEPEETRTILLAVPAEGEPLPAATAFVELAVRESAAARPSTG